MTEAKQLIALASEAVDRAKKSPALEAAPLLQDAIHQLQVAYIALQAELQHDPVAGMRAAGFV